MAITISYNSDRGGAGSSRGLHQPLILESRQVAFFPEADMIPVGWQHRATPGWLVTLLPGEADELADSTSPVSHLGPEDLETAHLVAAGLAGTQISRLQNMSVRSAERRIARLRDLCGVATTAELIAFLARRGF